MDVSSCNVSIFEIVRLLGLLNFKLLQVGLAIFVPLNIVLLNPFDPMKVPFEFEIYADGLT
jgi:hypothetical protein